jgi:hypothetical protein
MPLAAGTRLGRDPRSAGACGARPSDPAIPHKESRQSLVRPRCGGGASLDCGEPSGGGCRRLSSATGHRGGDRRICVLETTGERPGCTATSATTIAYAGGGGCSEANRPSGRSDSTRGAPRCRATLTWWAIMPSRSAAGRSSPPRQRTPGHELPGPFLRLERRAAIPAEAARRRARGVAHDRRRQLAERVREGEPLILLPNGTRYGMERDASAERSR